MMYIRRRDGCKVCPAAASDVSDGLYIVDSFDKMSRSEAEGERETLPPLRERHQAFAMAPV